MWEWYSLAQLPTLNSHWILIQPNKKWKRDSRGLCSGQLIVQLFSFSGLWVISDWEGFWGLEISAAAGLTPVWCLQGGRWMNTVVHDPQSTKMWNLLCLSESWYRTKFSVPCYSMVNREFSRTFCLFEPGSGLHPPWKSKHLFPHGWAKAAQCAVHFFQVTISLALWVSDKLLVCRYLCVLAECRFSDRNLFSFWMLRLGCLPMTPGNGARSPKKSCP